MSITRDSELPNYSTVARWLREDENFQQKYAHARDEQAEFLAQEILDIADGANPETVQVAKLQVDTRKWYAAKVKPRVYGDKPSEVHVNSTVNNFVVVTEAKLRELQDRRRLALEGAK